MIPCARSSFLLIELAQLIKFDGLDLYSLSTASAYLLEAILTLVDKTLPVFSFQSINQLDLTYAPECAETDLNEGSVIQNLSTDVKIWNCLLKMRHPCKNQRQSQSMSLENTDRSMSRALKNWSFKAIE